MSPLRRLLPFYTPYRGVFTAGLLCVVASAASASVIPSLLQRAVDALGTPEAPRAVPRVGVLMLAVTLGTGLLRFLMREILNGVSRRIETDLRDALFARLTTLDAAWYATWRTGDVMARLTNDLGAVRMAAGPAVMYLMNTIAGGLFALGFMLSISPTLTLLAVAPMVALPVVMIRLGRRVHDLFESVQAQFGALTTRVQEHVAGVRVVRAYRQEEAEQARFAALSEGYVARALALARLQGLTNPLLGLLAGLGATVVLGVGGGLALRGEISVGALVAFGLYLGFLTWPLIALGWVTNLFQRGSASMSRLLEVLDAEPRVSDPPAPRQLPPHHGGRAIELHHVSFAYPTPDGRPGRTVLHDISCHIPAGATVAVVGPTGSGKSTLLDLLWRAHDPTAGEIRLDGVPLRSLALAALRRELGVVPQEAFLFGEPLEANLRYGGAEPDAVRAATTLAQLDDTIARLPEGVATMLGERGVNLSGGQKQRATIARALARGPAVVILDDALSAVDTQTEAAILTGLARALAGRTALIASHRISAVRDADWILVLDEGRLVEQGRHAELMARRGRYWSLLAREQLEEAVAGESATATDADLTGASAPTPG